MVLGEIRDRYFESLSADPSDPRWKCQLCGRRTMTSYGNHMLSKKHLEAAARFEARQAAAHQPLPGLDPNPPPECPIPATQQEAIFEDAPPMECLEADAERPPSPLTFLQALEIAAAEDDNPASEDSDLEVDMSKLAGAIMAMANDKEDDPIDEAGLEAELRTVTVEESHGWYPFKKKEHLVALLIIGSTRSLLSRSQYHQIRSILHICRVQLPDWGVLRALSTRLKKQLGFTFKPS
ncbi:uncharacterized protein MELLADRAFT_91108 [Melampsora larici-populina 98AG31]|uniref:Uncharacterized protein n=1 Tax=Melampsora larici-populina (strain 98AG31 / pathotype 3-4-7) TaxID=747676 RepID=F4R765_MELLP|nr:uncharacterized protein MELLADRAFT_91108 [Melampsora larici-populina 98AG31]EGG11535.1 hypothetical protein MELLADRAFT_91108 [Melampsora larici-populina 98AG31]